MAIVHVVKGLLMLLACCRFPEFSRTLFLLHPQAGNREKVLSAWWIEKLHLWNEFHPFLRSGLLSFNSVSTQAKYLSTRSRLLAVHWSSWDARRQLLWRVYWAGDIPTMGIFVADSGRRKKKIVPKPMISSIMCPLINLTSLLLKYHVNLKDRDHHATHTSIPKPPNKQGTKPCGLEDVCNAELAVCRLAIIDWKQLALLQYYSTVPHDHNIVAY